MTHALKDIDLLLKNDSLKKGGVAVWGANMRALKHRSVSDNVLVLRAPTHLQQYFEYEDVKGFIYWVNKRRRKGNQHYVAYPNVAFWEEGLSLTFAEGSPEEWGDAYGLPFKYTRTLGLDNSEVVEAHWYGSYDQFLREDEMEALPILLTLILEPEVLYFTLEQGRIIAHKPGESAFQHLPIPRGRMNRVRNDYSFRVEDAVEALRVKYPSPAPKVTS